MWQVPTALDRAALELLLMGNVGDRGVIKGHGKEAKRHIQIVDS